MIKYKYQTLDAYGLSVVDIAGLSNETIIAGNAARPSLSSLGIVSLDVLVDADNAFRANLITEKASPLTEQIANFDKQRDDSFWEIKRTVKIAAKSSDVNKAEAGKVLDAFLKPYHNLAKEPLMSETSTINYLQTQYMANPALHVAVETLQLNDVFITFFNANEQVSVIWNERALAEAGKKAPSPSSLKSNLGKAYNDFCDIVLQSVKLQPAPELETLFSVMNEIRVKYAKSLPFKLTNANTVVEPVAIQKYTGKPVTPVTQVFIKK
ncbi:MAG: DUF6261 family protein [Bacteroidales bacterium]|jgi:hypothetical protein|nr:DUF6261 family protein [Bacteroidales bacterium]